MCFLFYHSLLQPDTVAGGRWYSQIASEENRSWCSQVSGRQLSSFYCFWLCLITMFCWHALFVKCHVHVDIALLRVSLTSSSAKYRVNIVCSPTGVGLCELLFTYSLVVKLWCQQACKYFEVWVLVMPLCCSPLCNSFWCCVVLCWCVLADFSRCAPVTVHDWMVHVRLHKVLGC